MPCEHIFYLNEGWIEDCILCKKNFHYVTMKSYCQYLDFDGKFSDPVGHLCVWDLETETCVNKLNFPDNITTGENYGFEKLPNGAYAEILERRICKCKMSDKVKKLICQNLKKD